MIRLLASTCLTLGLIVTSALAADTNGVPPTESNVPSSAAKAATVPPSGQADTSGGATEQSSSPSSAGSTMNQSAPTVGNTNPNPTAPSSGD